jgi:hypothetical protein
MKVFLGGTCNESRWRDELIPHLFCDYFNPVVSDWDEEAQRREIEERENADFVLYVITPRMTGVYSIAEVVDDSNKRPSKTLLCVLMHDGSVEGEAPTFSKAQATSLEAVMKLVERNGGKTFPFLSKVAEYLNGLVYEKDARDAKYSLAGRGD